VNADKIVGGQRSRHPGKLVVGIGVLALSLSTCLQDAAIAQTQTVERAAKGPPAKDIRVGVYLNVKPDCSSGALPSIRLVTPPVNGSIQIKRGKVSATNYKQCLALEVPGLIAFYKSKPEFSGVDIATIEVKYPAGRTEIQRISVTVSDGKSGQKI
jgi:hypothetical protein